MHRYFPARTALLPLLFFLLACSLSATTAQSAPAPVELRLCHPDQGDWPWTLPDRPGLNNLLIDRANSRLATPLRIRYYPMPWARCLFKLNNGDMDGAFNASFRPERLSIARYPLKDGALDGSRRLMHSSYTLYRLKGSSRIWDGKTLKVRGPVGTPNGYTAIAMLIQELGGQADQHYKYSEELFQALLDGQLEAVALKTDESEYLLRQRPEFRARIEAVSPLLGERDFFLIFSIPFTRQQPVLTEQLWSAIGVERETVAYQRLAADFK